MNRTELKIERIDGMQTLFLVVVRGSAVSGVAYEMDSASFAGLAAADEQQLMALYYEQPLPLFGLEPGEVHFEVAEYRAPPPHRAFIAQLDDENWQPMEPKEAPPIPMSQSLYLDFCSKAKLCIDRSQVDEPCSPCTEPIDLVDPTAAALPNLAPCPTGWEPETFEGVELCNPPLPQSCPAGQATFGGADCEPVGDRCPANGEPTIPPGSTVLRVPDDHATIQQALEHAANGDIIALSQNRYEERVAILDGAVTLWGSCAEQVVIASPGGAEPLVAVAAATVTLRNLTLEGGGTLLHVSGGASAFVHGVELMGTSTSTSSEGIVTTGTSRTAAEELYIHDTGKRGILATQGSTVTARKLEIANVTSFGINTTQGGVFDLEDVVIRDVERRGERWGRAIQISDGSMTLRRAVIQDAYTGIWLFPNAHATISDLVIRGPNRAPVDGFWMADNAYLEADRMVIRDARNSGLYVNSSEAVLSDTVIRNVRAVPAGSAGISTMDNRSRVTLNRVLIADVGRNGIRVDALKATDEALVEAFDLTVLRSEHTGEMTGHALLLYGSSDSRGATFLGQRLRFDQNQSSAVRLAGGKGQVEIEYALMENGAGGVLGFEGSTVVIANSRMRHNRGAALEAQDFATNITATNVAIETNISTAVRVEDAEITMNRFEIVGSESLGVIVEPASVLRLTSGRIADGPVGVVVKSQVVEVVDILDGVVYENVDQPIRWLVEPAD